MSETKKPIPNRQQRRSFLAWLRRQARALKRRPAPRPYVDRGTSLGFGRDKARAEARRRKAEAAT